MNILRTRWVQLGALVFFLSTVGIIAFGVKYSVLDYDIWWHLKVGDWIIHNSTVPHTGILSRVAAEKPWVPYSWGYEVLLSRWYSWLGVVGLGVFGTALTISVAFSTYWMLRHLSGRFWFSIALAGVVCSAFLFDLMPRPVYLSQILFCVILTLLLEAQRTAQLEKLYFLPPLFLLWANLHIQFIYGLCTVGLFVGAVILKDLIRAFGFGREKILDPSTPWRPLVVVLLLCTLATMIGPNTYHPYLAALAYSKANFTYSVVMELQPLNFRSLDNYTELFLAAAGFYAVGWRRKLDIFKLGLLVVASVAAFRTMRDAWFLCLAAAACIADQPDPEGGRAPQESWSELCWAGASLVLILFLAAPLVNFNASGLDAAISRNYPVDAVNFLRKNSFRGPLYNNLNWGGFLMWYLPQMPVAIDGRNDVYGDDLVKVFFESQSGYPSYKTDPYLNEAGTVIIDSQLPLAKLLTIDSRFRLIYRDNIATVFVRQ